MTKNEFLSTLSAMLTKKGISDAADIVNEYEQHFAFKLADGFSEEEIAAKLGNPAGIAAQYKKDNETKPYGGQRVITIIGLCFADLFAGMFFVLFAAWGVVMAAFSLACAAVSVCLIGGLDIYALIPPMPYWCGAIAGLSLAALAVLAAVGCIYYAAFLRQLLRSFGRFQHNALAASSGKATLPSLAFNPQISAKTNRRIRSIALISLVLFAVCFVITYIVCALSAGSLEFWHTWGWFGHIGLN